MAWEGKTYETSRKQFEKDLNRVKLVDECTHWCIVWGCADQRPRDVITIWSSKWMIYDRYGQFTFQDDDENRRVAVQRVATAEPCPEPESKEDTHGPP